MDTNTIKMLMPDARLYVVGTQRKTVQDEVRQVAEKVAETTLTQSPKPTAYTRDEQELTEAMTKAMQERPPVTVSQANQLPDNLPDKLDTPHKLNHPDQQTISEIIQNIQQQTRETMLHKLEEVVSYGRQG